MRSFCNYIAIPGDNIRMPGYGDAVGFFVAVIYHIVHTTFYINHSRHWALAGR